MLFYSFRHAAYEHYVCFWRKFIYKILAINYTLEFMFDYHVKFYFEHVSAFQTEYCISRIRMMKSECIEFSVRLCTTILAIVISCISRTSAAGDTFRYDGRQLKGRNK